MVVSAWKVFKKAGVPGWAAIIPIYNEWKLLEIGGQPGWWAIVSIIPFIGIVTIVPIFLAYKELAKRFGKSLSFAIFWLLLFGFIGYPILAFGKATYNSPGSFS